MLHVPVARVMPNQPVPNVVMSSLPVVSAVLPIVSVPMLNLPVVSATMRSWCAAVVTSRS
ncbi:hypothetical protein [Nocardia otitidiscaviarum]|uniref:hypothetical protein n=1 Tax=Nocardia otitidiscaviarum TaxID=1823 RepID=UPI001892D67A|nr:hypothetical protein [Nocardia otitidiscaviarum]MBF6237270.1 hypothetical protein [Nocardia otitidiscaviarum]